MVLDNADGGSPSPPTISGDKIIWTTTDSVIAVPQSGGTPMTVASEHDVANAVVVGDVIYFHGLKLVPNSDPSIPPQAVAVVYSVPLAGGTPTIIDDLGDLLPLAADDSSIYLGGNAVAIRRWTPASGESSDLRIDTGLLVDDIAIAGDYVYVAAQDIATGGLTNGVIARIAKAGGQMNRLVTNIGHPFHVKADSTGIYWAEDPPALFGAGTGRLARSDLSGGSSMALVSGVPRSLAVIDGQVLFSTGVEINRVSTKGGKVTPVATGLMNAGMLVGAKGYVVWVDPAQQAFSGTTSPNLMITCLPP
jgi:hypothetical protein